MRVGVGVGAVVLGSGCDAIAEAKARVLGDDAEVTADVAVEPVPTTPPPTTPEPMLLGRDGVAGVVEQTIARSNAAALADDRVASPRPRIATPVEDLGRPRSDPERSHAFVPYAGEGGSIGAIAVAPEPPLAAEKPRTRTRPKPVRAAEPEPCDPLAAPPREWVCGPCGRG